MSKGYLIAHLKEHDPEGMEKFKQITIFKQIDS
jgi:uncharacterized protein (DUF1330 family)